MSLKAWYPLINGLYKNQGTCRGGDIYSDTISFESNDNFLGNFNNTSYIGGNIKWTAEQAGKIFNNESLSIAFWIKPIRTEGFTGSPIFGNTNMNSASNNRKFTLFQYVDGKNDSNKSEKDSFNALSFHWSWMSNTEKITIANTGGTLGNCFKFDTWSHVCVVYKKGSLKIYIDNEKRFDAEVIYDSDNFNFETTVFYNDSSRLINDLRVYDHALSDSERYDIYKPLACHYNFELIKGDEIIYQNQENIKHESNKEDGYQVIAENISVIPGETYLFEFKTDGNYRNSHGGGADPSEKKCLIMIYFKKTGESLSYSPALYLNNVEVIEMNNYKQCRTYFTVPTNRDIISLRTNTYSNNIDIVTVNFWDFKITNVKFHDLSGYKNDPLKINNISYEYYDINYENDTNWAMGSEYADILKKKTGKLGEKAGIFNGTNSYIELPNRLKLKPPFTVSLWAYMDNWADFISQGMRLISCTDTGGYSIEVLNGNPSFALYDSTDSYGTPITVKKEFNNFTKSSWHLFNIIISETEQLVYIDGENVGKRTLTGGLKYNPTNKFLLGAEPSLQTIGGNYFNGRIDDFRIYKGALSAEEVKELYNTRMTIDNYSNLKVGQLVVKGEKAENEISEKGILECDEIYEIPSDYQMVEYIKTGEGSYLDTGLTGFYDWVFEIQFDKYIEHRQLIGFGPYGAEYWGVNASNIFEIGASSTKLEVDNNKIYTIKHYFDSSTSFIYIDGNKYSNTNTNYIATEGKTYKLFDLNSPTGERYYCYCKLYSTITFNHYDGSIKSMYIPCKEKRKEQRVGLYDIIRDRFDPVPNAEAGNNKNDNFIVKNGESTIYIFPQFEEE